VSAAPVTMVAFDLLQVGARALTRSPFRQRRALLVGLGLETAGVIISPLFDGKTHRTYSR
jgi:ATP-dependent DNA ligase